MTSDLPADTPDWQLFQGDGGSHARLSELPPAPPWRPFARDKSPVKPPNLDDDSLWAPDRERAKAFVVTRPMRRAVNAALYLRRPLLVTGKPGTASRR